MHYGLAMMNNGADEDDELVMENWIGIWSILSMMIIEPVSMISWMLGSIGGSDNLMYHGYVLDGVANGMFWMLATIRAADAFTTGLGGVDWYTAFLTFCVLQVMTFPELIYNDDFDGWYNLTFLSIVEMLVVVLMGNMFSK